MIHVASTRSLRLFSRCTCGRGVSLYTHWYTVTEPWPLTFMQQLSPIRLIHYSLAFFWCYQGLIPKLLFISPEEIAFWQWLGLNDAHARLVGQASGLAEILFGLAFIFIRHRYLHYLNMLGLLGLLGLMAIVMPHTLLGAFNPVVMNGAMLVLSLVYLALNTPEPPQNKPNKTQVPPHH